MPLIIKMLPIYPREFSLMLLLVPRRHKTNELNDASKKKNNALINLSSK